MYDEAARAIGATDVSVLWIRPVRPPRVEAVVTGRVPTRPYMRAAPSHRISMCATLATDGAGMDAGGWRNRKRRFRVAKSFAKGDCVLVMLCQSMRCFL